MKKYLVTVPVAGFAVIQIEAKNESDAVQKAKDNVTLEDIEEWDAYSQLCRGNVMMYPINEAEVEEIA